MRVNTSKSIHTANRVHDRYGSWRAAKAASVQKDGKFIVASDSAGHRTKANGAAGKVPEPKHKAGAQIDSKGSEKSGGRTSKPTK